MQKKHVNLTDEIAAEIEKKTSELKARGINFNFSVYVENLIIDDLELDQIYYPRRVERRGGNNNPTGKRAPGLRGRKKKVDQSVDVD